MVSLYQFPAGIDCSSLRGNFSIQQATTDQLSFSLPESTPSEISITGPSDHPIKETSSQIVDGYRIWKVRLAAPVSGVVRLSIDFQENTPPTSEKEWNGVTSVALDVAYQSGLIAIEADNELEVIVGDHPREADIGQLIDAEYQVGKRLIGVYGYIEDDRKLSAQVTQRSGYSLPTTIVERAELVTHISSNGKLQTIARYRLISKGDYISASLPKNGALWSVLIDGNATLPQRDGEQVILQLPISTDQSNTHDLHILFEMPANPIVWRGSVELFAPKLAIRKTSQVSEVIPLGKVDWFVATPQQYELVHSKGSLFSTSIQRAPLLWQHLTQQTSNLLSPREAFAQRSVFATSEVDGPYYLDTFNSTASRVESTPYRWANQALPRQMDRMSHLEAKTYLLLNHARKTQ